ncbi:MAG: hypothetical protein JXA20_18870 [Spirochaetes bacterium]|nr:hypothetical protein [Spirochaetota bacterium]
MKNPALTGAIIVLLTAAVLPAAETFTTESGGWTRIVIKEAFISRQTSIDFRDPSSPPEFGWHVKCGGSFATRGRSLYSTMYAPCRAGEGLRLYLMELDILSDDIVSSVALEPDTSKYLMNGNGDFAVLEITSFYPDARSGGDAQPGDAVGLAAERRDSVSFLDGDYTDCYRLPPDVSRALIIASSPSLSVDAPGAPGIAIHPRQKAITTVTIAAAEIGGGVVRVRGRVSLGRIGYSISPVKRGAGFAGMIRECLKYLPDEKSVPRSFLCRDMARALISLDRGGALLYCAGTAAGGPADGERPIDCLCGAVRQVAKMSGGRGKGR